MARTRPVRPKNDLSRTTARYPRSYIGRARTGDGADEVFTLATGILAVEGPTAVVRAEVRYGDPSRQEYRGLWVMRLRDDGRCTWFEEWPYWPERPYTARDDPT